MAKIATLPKKLKVYTPVNTFYYMLFSLKNNSISTFTKKISTLVTVKVTVIVTVTVSVEVLKSQNEMA